MLPTPSGFVVDAFVQVTIIFGILCCSGVVVMHVRVTAVGAVVVGLVVLSMGEAVVLVSIRFGSSSIIIPG